MPTDVNIKYLTCNLDNEQDPPVWTCNWLLSDPLTGTIYPTSTVHGEDEDIDDAIDALESEGDYVIV